MDTPTPLASRIPHESEQLLLRLFQQVGDNLSPAELPDVPIELFPEGSQARHLLEGFSGMLARLKEKEDALRRSQRSYEQLVNSLDGIVWEADASTVEFLFVSQQAERLLGYPTERWTTEPTFWQDHMHPDDRGWAPLFCSRATAQRRDHEFEYRMIAADGRIVWLRDIVTVVVENDRPVRLRGVMVDITEQKKAAEGLREKEEQYRAIFEATTEGLVINDQDGNVVEANPAFCEMHGYTREELIGRNLASLHPPDDQPTYNDYLEAVSNNRSFQTHEMHSHLRKDGTTFQVEVRGTTFMYRGEPHILGVTRDVTERVHAYELLEQRVQERTRELSTLLEVSHNVTSTLDLNRLVSSVLEQLKVVADYSGSAILLVDGNELKLLDIRGANPNGKALLGRKVPLERLGAMWPVLRSGEPVIVDDVRGDDLTSQTYREVVAELLGSTSQVVAELLDGPFAYDRSFLAVPIIVKEQLVGLFTLTHGEPGFYTPRHAGLAMAVANQAALAIENARLYEHAQQASRSTAALAQIASRVAYGGSLQKTLDDICQHVVVATGAAAAGVVLYDTESGQRSMVGAYGLPEGYKEAVNAVLGSGTVLFAQAAFDGQQPVVTRDTRRKVLESEVSAPLHPYMPTAPWDTVVAVPMVYQGKQLGVLASYLPTIDVEESEIAFHAAIADQTAVAVENARLIAEVHDKATLEQRQRLARELHDSVSQALFSINLTARAVESLLKRETPQTDTAVARLADLRQLTQGALAEMRALIFELRPRALEEEGLLQALRKHGSAVAGREMLQVEVVCPPEERLPRLKPAAEEALYRIAQEALHNVVKHARATRVEIHLDHDPDEQVVSLCIADNGRGFDKSQVPAGHMGLGTMGQRATALGGEYTIESKPGEGTRVTVRVPLREWRLDAQKATK